MSREEELKSMITNMIDDKTTEASVDFHKYLQAKMSDVLSTANTTKEQQTPADKKDQSAD